MVHSEEVTNIWSVDKNQNGYDLTSLFVWNEMT